MARRKRRGKGLKRAFLTAAAVVAGSSGAAGCRPAVCDPAPPPSTSPRPTPDTTMTPMICDPPPPPASAPPPTATSTVTPTVTSTVPPVIPMKTPMICDPAPAPPVGPGPLTPIVTREFRAQGVEVTTDPSLQGAAVRGQVLDVLGRPVALATVVAYGEGLVVEGTTDADGAYDLQLTQPGAYLVAVGQDQANGVTLTLTLHQVATVTWREVVPDARLPLAEIREVKIAWQGGLEFLARSAWPGAQWRWSVSGGALAEAGQAVTWQPPAEPGRYLLQVVADWGADGLAVDATTLTVEDSGRIVVG